MRILMVDDDEDILELYQEFVNSFTTSIQIKMEILLAKDGNEAVDTLKTEQVDLVITDLKMPNKDGYDLIKEARAQPNNSQLSFILVTGMMKEIETLLDEKDLEFVYVVEKPINNKKFQRLLKLYLAKSIKSDAAS